MKPLKAMAAALILALGVSILAFAMNGSDAAKRDYMCYWSAGQRLVHRQNPYDREANMAVRQAYGASRVEFMRNPPYAFFLALPLGFVTERSGAVLWSLAIIASLMASIRLLRKMYGGDGLYLLCYCFPPVIACILAGQIATFILLGLVLFLYFRETKPYLAGAALLLCCLKPHLFVSFGLILLLWIVMEKRYRILAGMIAALSLSLLLALYLDPHGWSHYFAMMRDESLNGEFIPTVSFFFRLAIHRDSGWLQFVPALLASVWAIWYFRKGASWSWEKQGFLLLLVSVMTAPYAWFTDETVLLPAIFLALSRRESLVSFYIIAGVAFLEVMGGVGINSGLYAWTAPAWLLWYALGRHKGRGPRNAVEIQSHPAGRAAAQT